MVSRVFPVGLRVPLARTKEGLVSPDLWRSLLWIILSLLFLLGFSRWVHWFARDLPVFLADTSRIETIRLPIWAPSFWKEEVKEEFRSGSVRSIFDQETLNRTRERLLSLPFIEEVGEISRRFPRSFFARVAVRRPVALVAVEGKWYAIDRFGVLLPGRPKDPGGGFALPLPVLFTRDGHFTGVPVRVGEVWDDPVVRSGRSVAAEIRPILNLQTGFRIQGIDLSNLGGRLSPIESEIVLRTNHGVRILWGRSGLGNPYGELSPDEKIRNFIRVLEQYPSLRGVRELDLRFDRPAVTLVDFPPNAFR